MGTPLSRTDHVNKSYKFTNDYFSEPHPFPSTQGAPKGERWPGFKSPKTRVPGPPKTVPDKNTAPAELRPRKRRTSQEV